MHLKELIRKIAKDHSPDLNFENYMDDFVPNVLLKSETLQKAYGVSDSEMEHFYRQGYEHYLDDRYRDALNFFHWLTILNPFVAKYWLGLGANRQLLADYEKALMAYAMALLVDEENPHPHYHAYECYEALDNHEDAIKALRSALEKTGTDPHYGELRHEIRKKLKDKNVSLYQ